ncbi:MAG: MoaD/ThiS family protein [Candidatus Thermoplasmatota archaeon]|jgi:molybdopterin synthase sulfur carrier subunit|nr:MoaD/ThiS family protein [Candidatus Thermoplasmatota archaeon]
MKMSVMLFAQFRELAGSDAIQVEMPGDGSWTVELLKKQISIQHPPLSALMDSCLVAVNEVFAGNSAKIFPGDSIALMPPVSGGL